MGSRRCAVLWSLDAERDLDEILEYIASESAFHAMRICERLERRAAALERLPLRGRVVPELARLGIDRWREVVEPPHRIIYEVRGRTVYVMAVLDGRRKLDELLVRRLVRS